MSLSSKKNFKNLGSPDRSGGYSRRLVLNTVKDFVQPNWAILLLLMLLPGTAGYLASHFGKESERVKWLGIGAFGITGFWLVIILVIIWTGIGNPLMGLEGENRTAVILRKFRSNGWELVNGLKLRGDWDIDHVLVGPAGVLVFESKWSHKEWPSDNKGDTYMAGRLEDAVKQVLRNGDRFKAFFKNELVGVTVTPACVLWSHSYGSEELTPYLANGVVIIPGPALESWMNSLTANWLDQKKVERLSTVLEIQTAIRDKQDSESEDAPLPTLGTLIRRNILAPILGFAMGLYGIALLTSSDSLWIDGALLVAFSAVGSLLTKRFSLRRLGQGWLAACFGYFCVFIVALIQTFTR